MRFNQQGIKKMVTDEQKAAAKPAVERGAEVFAALEASAAKNKGRVENLVGVLEAIRDAGVISPFECHAHASEARALAVSHYADWMVLHHKLVRRCVDLDIDVPAPTDPDLPQPMDGGGHR